MKLFAWTLCFALVGLVAAWSKEDYEIFRLHDELTTAEGPNMTFYDFLEIRSNAKQEQITKAYRKKARLIHPDKAKRNFIANYSKDKSKAKSKQGVNVSTGPSKRQIDAVMKDADLRSKRLNLIADILRGPGRERYDHFLKNGFPRWKGTGYYYERFRPGLGTVLTGLFVVFGGAAHYAALVLGWKRQREFVDRYIRQARRAAWGDELGVRGIPGIDSVGATAPPPAPDADDAGAVAMNRRQKRMMDKENRKENKKSAKSGGRVSGTSTPTTESAPAPTTGERKRVVAENGKVLIVDSIGNVFLEEENEDGEKQEFLLDVGEIQRPRIRDTVLFKLPIWCFRKTVGRVMGTADKVAEEDEVEEAEEAEEAANEEVGTSTGTKNGGSSRRRAKKRAQRS